MSKKTEDKPNVSTPNAAHNAMMIAAQLPRTLMAGTYGMRAAGKEFLPQEPKETDDLYKNRLARTFLFNKYGMTIEEMVGRLFRNGIKLEKIPGEVEALFADIDLTGRDLRRFVRDLFESALQPGVDYLLVDYAGMALQADPAAEEGAEPPVMSKADEKAAGVRPFWVHVKQENVINWRTEVINGQERLARLQIMEHVEEQNGDWGTTNIDQVKVLYPGRWETWRVNDAGDWAIVKSGVTTLDFIPLVPVYTKRTGFMTGEPPLAKLAELNLAHWQSSSDQRNILHVARVPILFGAGFESDGSNNKLAVGPNTMVTNSDPQSKLTFVEHTGKAIEAGHQDLEDLENQMKICALEPIMPKTGNVTATAKAIDTSQSAAILESMGEDLSDALEQAIKFTLAWLGTPDVDSGSIMFECDLTSNMGNQPDLDALDKGRARKDISRTAYCTELVRRGVLSEEYDIEADQALIDEEGPSLGDIGNPEGALGGDKPPAGVLLDPQGKPMKNADGTWKMDPAKVKKPAAQTE